jgi:hypothetical protein
MSEKPRFTTRLQWVNPHTGQMTSEAQRILSALIEGLWTRSGLLTSDLITGTAGSADTLAKWNSDGDLVTVGNAAAARTLIGAVNIAGDTMTGGLKAPMVATTSQTVADDGVYSVEIPFTSAGFVIANAGSTPATGLPQGIYWIRKSANAPVLIVAFSTATITLTTGVLTGTTGIDGNSTMSVASSTTFYFENRSAASQTMTFTFIGA